jgi:hypothetical protein
MPEASVDEDSNSGSLKDDVRTTRTVGFGSDVDTEAQSAAVESGT